MPSNQSFKANSAGEAINGLRIKLHSPNEKGIGEICFLGRNVFMGYFKNEEETLKVLDN